MRGSIVGLAVLAGALAGCSSSATEHHQSTSFAPTSHQADSVVWRNSSVQPLTSVRPVRGGIATYLGKDSGRLVITALDVKSGKTKWSHPATAAGGDSIGAPVVLGQNVAYLAPGKTPDEGKLTIVDGSTGKVLARSEPVSTNGTLFQCRLHKDRACFYGHAISAGKDAAWTVSGMSAGSSKLLTDPNENPEVSAGYARGKFYVKVAHGDRVVNVVNPPVVKTSKSFNVGYVHDPIEGVMVVNLSSEGSMDSSEVVSFGFDVQSGKVTWTHTGLADGCAPSVAVQRAGYSPHALKGDYITCRLTGVHITKKTEDGVLRTVMTGGRAEVVGIAPGSGKVLWSVPAPLPAGDKPTLYYSADGVSLDVPHDGSVRRVNTLTNKSSRPLAGQLLWHPEAEKAAVRIGGKPAQLTVDALFLPHVNGKVVEPSGPVPNGVGARSGGVTAVATKTALVGLG